MRVLSLCLALLMAACAAAPFPRLGEADLPYAGAHPYFAEYCALSQIKKRRGFGADIRGEIGGHAVFYLQGACRDPADGYPVLHLCTTGGSGLSMNAHFSNAKWVAVPGGDLFFDGAPGAAVTRDTYEATQREAKRRGVYDGVAFWDRVFDDMPAGWSREDWKYEMSIGTDYGIALARGRYCLRVPVDRAAMARMIAFLNAENAPYRAGREFHWSVFTDNCIHLAHNALAAAGLWARWPTGRPLIVSMFDFPVPRNEFVNLARRTNDAFPRDPGAAWTDPYARQLLLGPGTLPSLPGALALVRPQRQPNALYDSDLALVFYDEPIFGSYRPRFERIVGEPRYTDPAANRDAFAEAARAAIAARQPLDAWLARAPFAADPPGFAALYAHYYALMDTLARPDAPAPPL